MTSGEGSPPEAPRKLEPTPTVETTSRALARLGHPQPGPAPHGPSKVSAVSTPPLRTPHSTTKKPERGPPHRACPVPVAATVQFQFAFDKPVPGRVGAPVSTSIQATGTPANPPTAESRLQVLRLAGRIQPGTPLAPRTLDRVNLTLDMRGAQEYKSRMLHV